jgi:hypothetical protein
MGVWRLAFGVRRSALGAWRLADAARQLSHRDQLNLWDKVDALEGTTRQKAIVRQLDSIAGHYIQLKKLAQNHFGRGSVKTWTPVCRLTGWTW